MPPSKIAAHCWDPFYILVCSGKPGLIEVRIPLVDGLHYWGCSLHAWPKKVWSSGFAAVSREEDCRLHLALLYSIMLPPSLLSLRMFHSVSSFASLRVGLWMDWIIWITVHAVTALCSIMHHPCKYNAGCTLPTLQVWFCSTKQAVVSNQGLLQGRLGIWTSAENASAN
jgi:hypothetical protein